jgi:putative PIN family toxin of toxin-antitoxin system
MLVEAGRLELLLSTAIISELRDVLLRTEVRRRFPVLSVEFVDVLLARLHRISTFVDPVPARFRFPRDPDDEPYLNLAAHVRAEYLVTRDRDLLDLADSTADEAQQFRRICPGLKILDPVGLLQEIVAKPK